MKLNHVQATSITQLPAILREGILEVFSADLLGCDDPTLKTIASAMGGTLVYVKVQAIYIAPLTNEQGKEMSQLCTYKDCYSVGDVDHPIGRCSNHATI